MTDESPNPGMQALSDALNASFRAFRFLILGLLAAYLASGIFIVRQHEKAFVLNFGKLSGLGAERIKDPGIHWTWPRPFSEIVKVPAERVQTLTTTSFWHRQNPEYQEEDVTASGPTLDPERDGYVLTGDANILHAQWTVRYTVASPEAYAFQFTDIDQFVRHELDHAVVQVSARFATDRALRTDIASLREGVERELSKRCAAIDLGIKIQGVDMTSTVPPQQVAAAFDSVVQAEQDRAGTISEARAYAARTQNEAAGEAAKRRVEGETYKRRLLADIQADADSFTRVYANYAKNPDVFMQTMLQDTLRRTLSHVEQKYIVHGSDGQQEIRLQLGPEQRKPAGGLE
jgi:membrane protease subunit HflK